MSGPPRDPWTFPPRILCQQVRTCYLCHKPLLWDDSTVMWLDANGVQQEVHSACRLRWPAPVTPKEPT